MNERSTAAIHVSTMGARIRAATKPRTTEGSEAIISMAGFTTERTSGPMNSEVKIAPSTAMGIAKIRE